MIDKNTAIRARSDRLFKALTLVWLILVLASGALMWRYKMTGGAPADAPARWPTGLDFPRAEGRPTLVMIAHPKCACTRASISELERLLSSGGQNADVHVLFVRPTGTPDGWERSDTYARASQLPGVHVHSDIGAASAKRFGAHVSGETLLYDVDGALLYHGGITGARGHEGDNAGRSRVLALLQGQVADRRDGPTFGCDIGEQRSRQ